MTHSENIFNINKPVDWTSFDVVNKIRYTTRIKKVGHAGTLDPFATGVLIVLTGKNTKRQDEFMSMPKCYEATLKLGARTDTGDLTGAVINELPVPQDLDQDRVETVCAGFVGEIDQLPPMYSAKKVAGKKLYELARQGKTVERQPSRVMIYGIDVLSIDAAHIKLHVKCGRGTYMRVLAEDIARQLGTEAHLTELVRTAVGDYVIKDALSITEFIENWKSSAA